MQPWIQFSNKMDNIEVNARRAPKPTLRDALFLIIFLTIRVVWFFSAMLVMTEIEGLMGHIFESPIPLYLHPVAWAFAIIGGLFMKVHNPQVKGKR